MRWFVFLPFFICVLVVGEAGYLWLNGLEPNWASTGFTALYLGVAALASRWVGERSERTRSARRQSTGLTGPCLWLLFGATGVVISARKAVDALMTGRVMAASRPEAYTAWSANPVGFTVTLGLDVLGVIFFLAVFIVAALAIWSAVRARRGPAWP